MSKLFGIFAVFLPRIFLYGSSSFARFFLCIVFKVRVARFRSGELDYNTKAAPACQAVFEKFHRQKKPPPPAVFKGLSGCPHLVCRAGIQAQIWWTDPADSDIIRKRDFREEKVQNAKE